MRSGERERDRAATAQAGEWSAAEPAASKALRKSRMQINDRLLRAATPAAILRVISEDGAAFNAVNAATAFHRLARLVRCCPPSPRAVTAGFDFQVQVLGLQPKDVANPEAR